MAISFCENCHPHEYQDQKLGQNMRHVNQTTKSSGNVYRCTVCSKEDTLKAKSRDWMPKKEK